MFSRYTTELDSERPSFHNIFTVPSGGSFQSIKTRAIVEHHGDDSGAGRWTCSKDPRMPNCVHIHKARDTLQKYVLSDSRATDPKASTKSLIYNNSGR